MNIVKVIADYQFGPNVGKRLFHDVVVKRSKTGMIRYVFDQNGIMLATLGLETDYSHQMSRVLED